VREGAGWWTHGLQSLRNLRSVGLSQVLPRDQGQRRCTCCLAFVFSVGLVHDLMARNGLQALFWYCPTCETSLDDKTALQTTRILPVSRRCT
jgi:hypothetical protein